MMSFSSYSRQFSPVDFPFPLPHLLLPTAAATAGQRKMQGRGESGQASESMISLPHMSSLGHPRSRMDQQQQQGPPTVVPLEDELADDRDDELLLEVNEYLLLLEDFELLEESLDALDDEELELESRTSNEVRTATEDLAA